MIMEAEQSVDDDSFQFCRQKVLTHTNDNIKKKKIHKLPSVRLWDSWEEKKRKKDVELTYYWTFDCVKMESENTVNFSNLPRILGNKNKYWVALFWFE